MRVFDRELSLSKGYTHGTHRACDPAETLARYRPRAAELGITRLANITGLDVIGLPVWVAVRPNSRGLSTSQGKGFDAASAKASAMMEAIESWHGEHIERPLRHDSYHALQRRVAVVDVTRLNTYADAVLRPDTPLLWIEGYDLMKECPMWVPFDCASTNYVWSGRGGAQASFVTSSNGLASGNHLLEAIAHGLAEIIERDAVTLTEAELRAGAPARRIDTRTLDDPQCIAVLELLARADVLVSLHDITSDTGIPTCACTIVDRAERAYWRTLPAFSGYGCHPSPAIAALRAITEAVQSRLTHISGSRDDIFTADYRRGGNPDDLRRYRELAETTPPAVDFARLRSRATATFEGDIAAMLDSLRRVGVDSAVVVDLTRPELGIPVVKLVVPGMEAPLALLGGRAIRPGGRARAPRPRVDPE